MVGEEMVGLLPNVAVACRWVKRTCILNYSLIGQKMLKLSHVFTYGWVGPLGWSAFMHFPETIVIKVAFPWVLPCKRSRQWLKPFLRYLIFMIFQKNLYNPKTWQVKPLEMKLYEWFYYRVYSY